MQALKDVALRLLNVYVSPYVENLNAHDLSLSVFGGVSFSFDIPKLVLDPVLTFFLLVFHR